MDDSGLRDQFPGQVINIESAVDLAIRAGLDEYLDDSQVLGSDWWYDLLHWCARRANGAEWADEPIRLRSQRTGETVVWAVVLRKRSEPELAHENLYDVVDFRRVDIDTGELI